MKRGSVEAELKVKLEGEKITEDVKTFLKARRVSCEGQRGCIFKPVSEEMTQMCAKGDANGVLNSDSSSRSEAEPGVSVDMDATASAVDADTLGVTAQLRSRTGIARTVDADMSDVTTRLRSRVGIKPRKIEMKQTRKRRLTTAGRV